MGAAVSAQTLHQEVEDEYRKLYAAYSAGPAQSLGSPPQAAGPRCSSDADEGLVGLVLQLQCRAAVRSQPLIWSDMI